MRKYLFVSASLKKFREKTLRLPPERQRYDFYSGKLPINGLLETYYDDLEDRIVYRSCEYKPLFNKTLFLKPFKTNGFTFDKATGKFKPWLGFNMATHLSTTFLDKAGIEWLATEGFYATGWLTPGLLGKVLKGKVTNPTEACKYLIGAYRWPKTTSPELFRKCVKGRADKKGVLYAAMVAKDINISFGAGWRYGVTADLVKQAAILGRKIDFNWSTKRIDTEHRAWTKEIMALEVESIDDVVLPYGELVLPKGVKLLRAKKEVFYEGQSMNHCIYTNYWSRIVNGTYLAFHVDSDEGGYTVGVSERFSFNVFNGKKSQTFWEVDQSYGYANKWGPKKDVVSSIFDVALLGEITKMMSNQFKIPIEDSNDDNNLPS